jgi:glycosyltransferase involved in cell wall biosynthesis
MGVSTKLYEYQAVGKPIICCSAGIPGVYVSETKSGIVIEPGDHESLAEAILHLENTPEIARQLGENGRRYVEEKVSVEKIGLEMIRIFKQTMRGNGFN